MPHRRSLCAARWLVLATALSVTVADATPQWQMLPLTPVGSRFDGLHFIDANHGWVCNGGGQVYRTSDGGQSWQMLRDYSDGYLRAIAFADLQHGWAGVLWSDTLLYQTTDGGVTWAGVTNIPEPRPNAICGLWVPSSQVIYGVGSFAGPARVIKSSDGGATWTSTDLDPLANTLVDVYFKNPSEGFAVGSIGSFPNANSAVVLHTTDGGGHWQQRFVGTRLGEWGWKISFPTPSVGYVSLERQAGPMFFLRTEDAGLTWSELPFPDYNEQGIGFATPSIGWVGGANNPTFATSDGGATWAEAPWGEYLDRFQFLSPTLGYASGVGIYKYSDPLAGVPHEIPPRPAPVAAPNPFVENTTIRFTLGEAEHMRLFIVDPTGRMVRTIADGMTTAGPHVVVWDGMNDRGEAAPAGIYIYVLHAGDQHGMGKLVRVR